MMLWKVPTAHLRQKALHTALADHSNTMHELGIPAFRRHCL